MRKSKAKETIIQTAQELIEKKGYSKLNINEVAYVADVSVGTLYYHFPKGKVDILTEIMSRKTESYVEKFNKQLLKENIFEKSENLDETLHLIFKKVIEFRRPDRQFLVGIQNEMFSNPEEYLELLERYSMTAGIHQGMGVLSEVLMKTSKKRGKTLSNLRNKQSLILRLVGLLISYQIIFPGYFGNDEEFIEVATDIFLHILNSSSSQGK